MIHSLHFWVPAKPVSRFGEVNIAIIKIRHVFLIDRKGIVLFRAAQNLKYLMKAKMAVKGTIYDVISRRGAGRD